jgi:hypothetical protein
MKGSEIVLTPWLGAKYEGIISGTPKPGVAMEVKNATPVSGRVTWQPYAPAGDGLPKLIAVLDKDKQQGFNYTAAYVSGTNGFLWLPGYGCEFNMRKADIAGTGTATEDLTVGQKLLLVSGTGYISPVAIGLASSTTNYPFTALEALTDQLTETLVHCMWSGWGVP